MTVLDYQWVVGCVLPIVEYLMLDLLYSGHSIFWVLDSMYLWLFDFLCRQKPVTKRAFSGSPNDWENPQVVGRNRCEAHTPLYAFTTCDEARKHWSTFGGKGNGSRFYLTNDVRRSQPVAATEWEFTLVGSPEDCPEGWAGEVMSDVKVKDDDGSTTSSGSDGGAREEKGWHVVSLPCHWQLDPEHPQDVPIYTNTSYPFRFDPPYVNRDGHWKVTDCDAGLGGEVITHVESINPREPGPNPTGLYRRRFKLPTEWTVGPGGNGDRIFITFEGVDAAMYLYVNGERVGYSQDSRLPAEFDVTDALRPGTDVEQLVCVQVMRWCDGSYLEDQDMWWLSGIYREVYLTRKPVRAIMDYELVPQLVFTDRNDTDLRGAVAAPRSVALDFMMDIEDASGSTDSIREEGIVNPVSDEALFVRVELSTVDGASIATHTMAASAGRSGRRKAADAHAGIGAYAADITISSSSSSGGMNKARYHAHGCIQLSTEDIKLWSAESPNLYICVLSLHASEMDAANGSHALDVESGRVGFRQVGIGALSAHQDADGPVLHVNNSMLTIRGVNRHEFCPHAGRAVDESTMFRDARIIKSLNFNAVRCSHYPNHPRWYEICDEVGLYVVDEANIETHGFQILGQAVGYLSSLTSWHAAHLSRMARMYERDKNYSSVIIWSLGNESGVGEAHEMGYRWLDARDPSRGGGWHHGGGESIRTLCGLGPLYRMIRSKWRWLCGVRTIEGTGRPIQYESGGAISHCTDLLCPMYLRPDWCRDKVGRRAWGNRDALKRPVVLCEYAHAMGNSGGGLSDYWGLYWSQDGALKRVQGGFIWEYIDQGLEIRACDTQDGHQIADTNGVSIHQARFGYGGNFGDVPNTSCFCITGLMAPDRHPHPLALEAWALQAPVQVTFECSSSSTLADLDAALASHTIKVHNRFDHSFLTEVMVELTLTVHAKEVTARPLVQMSKSLDSSLLDSIGPHTTSSIRLDRVLPSKCFGKDLGSLFVAGFGENLLLLEAQVHWRNGRKGKEEWIPAETPSLSAPAVLGVPVGIHVSSTDLTPSLGYALSAAAAAKGDEEEKEKHTPASEGDKPRNISFIQNSNGDVNVETTNASTTAGAAVATIGACGRLLALYTSTGQNTLASPLDICLARAPTNNDLGGMGLSYGARWESVGLASLGGLVRWGKADIRIDTSRLEVTARWTLVPLSHARVAHSAATKHAVIPPLSKTHETSTAKASVNVNHNRWRPSTRLQKKNPPPTESPLEFSQEVLPPSYVTRVPVEVRVVYSFCVNKGGTVRVAYCVIPPRSMPPLPRVGLVMRLPAPLGDSECPLGKAQVAWRGHGPYEAYPDRCAAVRWGVFGASARALAKESLGYVVPQECGARIHTSALAVDSRFGTLHVRSGKGMDSTDDGHFSWSVLPVSLDDLAMATHRHQLNYTGIAEHSDEHGSRGVDDEDEGSADSLTNLLSNITTVSSDSGAGELDVGAADKNTPRHPALPQSYLHVHVDSAVMGLGGYDSWSPNVRHDFLLPSGTAYEGSIELSFTDEKKE